jgi:hypothetical protein
MRAWRSSQNSHSYASNFASLSLVCFLQKWKFRTTQKQPFETQAFALHLFSLSSGSLKLFYQSFLIKLFLAYETPLFFYDFQDLAIFDLS